jgi:hypothetical protein
MNARLILRHVFIGCMALFVLTSCSRQVSTRLLFIGNSYTYVNGGIDKQLEGLALSSGTARIAVGGYTLEQHWKDGNALQTIRDGGWKYVILQEQSQTPIFDRSKFDEFATAFDKEIKRSGAKTILLMTWERPDSRGSGVTTANVAAAYRVLGSELGAKVAPVGLAFARSLRERPDLLLYSQDGHPTIYGTYLAACVLYRTIFASPVGNPYADTSIPTELREYFQRIAAESPAY